MKQSRTDSLMEALTNIVVGFSINFVANILILPAVLGVPVNLKELGTIGVFFTIVSVVRSYGLRRLFNGRTVWAALKSGFQNRKTPTKNTSGTPEGQLIKGY